MQNNILLFKNDELDQELAKQRKILEELTNNVINEGKSLGEDAKVVEQNRLVSKLVEAYLGL